MANYIPMFRSNYFAVKNIDKFKEFCEQWDLELTQDKELVGFLGRDENSVPTDGYYDSEKEEHVKADFNKALSQHLKPGHVAIYREVGYEKMSYLVGFSVAVNHKGEVLDMSLDEMYRRAKKLGKHATMCEY